MLMLPKIPDKDWAMAGVDSGAAAKAAAAKEAMVTELLLTTKELEEEEEKEKKPRRAQRRGGRGGCQLSYLEVKWWDARGGNGSQGASPYRRSVVGVLKKRLPALVSVPQPHSDAASAGGGLS